MMIRRPGRAGAGPRPVEVVVLDEQDDLDVGAASLADLAAAVLAAEGVDGPAELNLHFVDEATIAELNAEHMGEEGPTDVLAFPLDDPHEARPATMSALLGDVVVCPAVARRYATANGRSVSDELSLLVVHGLLHVLGHDHAAPDEAARMLERERLHLRTIVDPEFPR